MLKTTRLSHEVKWDCKTDHFLQPITFIVQYIISASDKGNTSQNLGSAASKSNCHYFDCFNIQRATSISQLLAQPSQVVWISIFETYSNSIQYITKWIYLKDVWFCLWNLLTDSYSIYLAILYMAGYNFVLLIKAIIIFN